MDGAGETARRGCDVPICMTIFDSAVFVRSALDGMSQIDISGPDRVRVRSSDHRCPVEVVDDAGRVGDNDDCDKGEPDASDELGRD